VASQPDCAAREDTGVRLLEEDTRMAGDDERIRELVLRAAADIDENAAVSCQVEDGNVILEGIVSSDEDAYRLEDAVRDIPGVRTITNDLLVERFGASVHSSIEGVDLSPDFTSEVGTPDYLESVSEAEPYTPPIDPVVKSDRSTDGIEMLNGFAEMADEEAAVAQLPGTPRGDDELREAVLAALHSDSATTDLAVDVEVQDGTVILRGTVPSLEDADLVESVASQVPGVEEVQEELLIEGL